MFKIIGLIAGYYFAGVTGALLGFVAGWFVDRVRNYGTGGANPLQNALRQTVFLETLFILNSSVSPTPTPNKAGASQEAKAASAWQR